MIMSIEDAIKHCKEVAEEQRELFKLCPIPSDMCDPTKHCASLKNGKNRGCLKCAEEHEQLAKWLRELKELKEHAPSSDENSVSNQSSIYEAKELNESTTKKDCNTCSYSNEIDGSNCYDCVKSVCNNYEPTTKNTSEVECVSKKAVDELIWRYLRRNTSDNIIAFYEHFLDLPPVTPQDEALDKIRSEIQAEMQNHSGSGDEVVQAYADGLHYSMRIIDKCRAELVNK